MSMLLLEVIFMNLYSQPSTLVYMYVHVMYNYYITVIVTLYSFIAVNSDV